MNGGNEKVTEMIMRGNAMMIEANKASIQLDSGFALTSIQAGLDELVPTVWLMYQTGNRIFQNPMAEGTGTTWKVMISIGAPQLGYVADGKRAAVLAPETFDRTSSFATTGMESNITWDAQKEADTSVFRAPGYDSTGMLNAHLGEQYLLLHERICMWANGDLPTGAASVGSGLAAAGGDLTAATYWLRVVPLTKDGTDLASVTNGLVQTVLVEPPAGGNYTLNGGTGLPGVAMGAGVAAALDDKITWAVDDNKSAVGYAWFVGVGGAAPADGIMYLQAITEVNTWTQETHVTTTDTISDYDFGTDRSAEPLATNGIYYQNFVQPVSGTGYYLSMDGLPLTIDAVGRISQWDVALTQLFDTYKIIPDEIIIAVDVHSAISGSVFVQEKSKFRLEFTTADMNTGLVAGSFLFGYRHPRTGTIIPIIADPNSPAGITHFAKWRHAVPNTITSYTVDYLAFGGATRIDWVETTRESQYGIYSRGTYRAKAPPFFGMIRNSKGIVEV